MRIVGPDPINLGGNRVHRHGECTACNERDAALTAELEDAKAQVAELAARNAELAEQLQRLTATPELRRRQWNFGGPVRTFDEVRADRGPLP